MKISEMLVREDFYSILKATLNRNRNLLGFLDGPIEINERGKDCVLFVNPQLNAIMASHPSREVVNFLRKEYNVKGSLWRRWSVKFYLFFATLFVRFFSETGISILYGKDIKNILIYPCNKKIRLFDFSKGIVFIVLKENFPDTYIERDIKFREENYNNFILPILNAQKGSYTERIIQGRSLARINDVFYVEQSKRKALELIMSLTTNNDNVCVKDYIESLSRECCQLLNRKPSFLNAHVVQHVFECLAEVNAAERCQLVISHGDLQLGNIWIDDENGQLIIIDWETVKKRSRFYDYVTLYLNIRQSVDIQNIYDMILRDEGLKSNLCQCSIETVARIVLAEELVYQTEELISFPQDIGINKYTYILNEYTKLKL